MTTKELVKALRSQYEADFLTQPILAGFQLALVVIGALFWVQSHIRPEAFSVAIYGEFALLFPAELWAALMMAPAAMCWVGLRHPVKRWMVATGSTIQVLQFLALAYSAISTGGEPIIGFFCSVLFAPLYAVIAWESLRHADNR